MLQQFLKARMAGAPLVAIRTADTDSAQAEICSSNHAIIQKFLPANEKVPIETFLLEWNCVDGLKPMMTQSAPPDRNALAAYNAKITRDKNYVDSIARLAGGATALQNPVEMLVRAADLKGGSILFMVNLHRFFNDPQVIQGIANLRYRFKQDQRTLVLVSHNFRLPPEIANDVVVLDEALPGTEQIEKIITNIYEAADVKAPDKPTLAKCVDATLGLSAFAVEQVCAMNITSQGMDVPELWESKRKNVEQTPGLSVWRGGERFADLAGLNNVKGFLDSIMRGPEPPRAVVFQDEIEKAFAGSSGGDLSGVTTELLGEQLSYMQDNNSTGLMLLGLQGGGKSAIAKAFGNEAGIPTIQFNLGAMKASLMGESNSNMRNALKVVEAVSQGRAIWIATCNNVETLPPELRRRYLFGTFFFDLPTLDERVAVWNIYMQKWALPKQEKPNDFNWTQAEIKNCCYIAYSTRKTLVEAAKLVVPAAISQKERIVNMRKQANGKYISASHEGVYKAPDNLDVEHEEEPTTIVVGIIKGESKRKLTPQDMPANKKPN